MKDKLIIRLGLIPVQSTPAQLDALILSIREESWSS
jgi:hypothetical protein